jgi:RNA polymerase sigma-70 factor, ECF subfamily
MEADISQIWRDFHKELKGYITKTVKSQTDADDILQEVFIKIIRNNEKVNMAKDIRQYIYGIVRNAIRDYFRNKPIIGIQISHVITEEEDPQLNATIAECCVKPFIKQLPRKYKEALVLTEIQLVSQKDLAEKLNISYSGAKSRVQRGKEKLKEMILNCCSYQADAYGNLMEGERKNGSCT